MAANRYEARGNAREPDGGNAGTSMPGHLSQAARKCIDLLSEFPRTLLFKLRQVVQLPANPRKMFEVRDSQQRPLRTASDQ